MINHQKTFTNMEEVRKFVAEQHEFKEHQYIIAVNGKIYRAANVNEVVSQISQVYNIK